MSVKQFISSKLFLRQLMLAFAAGIVIIWGSLKLLDVYTHHGRTIVVPDLEGLAEPEVRDLLEAYNLRYLVNDSIFDEQRDKGTISSQDPAPGTEVKKNRTIYLTMVAIMPEMVFMPDLTDLSLRQAMSLLETHGLRPGLLEYRPDIARDAVLRQKFKGGIIEPGTLVEKGTAIDLVLGEGLGQHSVLVPLVIGKTPDEAVLVLNAASLNLGNAFYLDDDSLSVRVYRQQPNPLERRQYLLAGSTVDLYYRSELAVDFESYLRELLTVAVPMLFGKTPEEARETLAEFGLLPGTEVFENDVDLKHARVYRQEPEYDEDALIQAGSRVDIWYRAIEDFELENL